MMLWPRWASRLNFFHGHHATMLSFRKGLNLNSRSMSKKGVLTKKMLFLSATVEWRKAVADFLI